MSSGFFGGFTPAKKYVGGTTLLDEDRGGGWDINGHRAPPLSEEELIAREHGRNCPRCRSGKEPKCASCGAVTSELARLKHYCWGCAHLCCGRHALWPNRKHLPEDHGPATMSALSTKTEYMRVWRSRRRGLTPA